MHHTNQDPPASQEPSGNQLELAHQRLLTYLKALHIPVRKRYDLAERSLALAGKNCPPGGNFIGQAIQSLHGILNESGTPLFQHELTALDPMPPLNRGSMIPVAMERSGPITFFFTLFMQAVKKVLKPPLRLYFLLLLLAGTLFLYWWLGKV